MSKDNQLSQWEVFMQTKNGGPFEHQGSLHAADKKMALQNARDLYSRRKEGRSIWVVPTECIVASTKEMEEEFFDPANDKIYRTPNFYKMPQGTKNL
ncbi:MAG TPA: 1,2-phenylacetyl-CoA epoxidase subunit B [Bacteroidia bacterium]|nr:MAG: phenylacetate-CoA oxygenase subunit PaaH [Bacteroidetes bacterium OLB10]MBE7511070.1 1,2-phenylacetyl-CoA epoxidase subunit B [Bacteroidia bacterium]MBX3105616.1 1,2-phenylacetyl-CoA epoxidase subunit B [Bacteroidota bacterium]MCE7954827.1 1,2-phenylacetyl-CoA epoxidase subunit B [Bacteroidetes bacterium CHB6]OQB61014.1 MAG: 1,2-phenylacetyl-CoA epoxidase, subunit B [Bacteroidetes bacterium ADurb.Bin141]